MRGQPAGPKTHPSVVMQALESVIEPQETVFYSKVFGGYLVTDAGGALHAVAGFANSIINADEYIGVAVTNWRLVTVQFGILGWDQQSCLLNEISNLKFSTVIFVSNLEITMTTGAVLTIGAKGLNGFEIKILDEALRKAHDAVRTAGQAARRPSPPRDMVDITPKPAAPKALPTVQRRLPAPAKTGESGAGTTDQLLRLAQMYKEGMLTVEEFTAMKRKLLGL